MNHDSDDMIEKRKRRSKLRAFRNLLLFLLIVGFCGYLYVQRDMWIPKLEGIGSRYDSVTQNDGTLAEGNFPLTISGSSSYQADIVDDTLFLLHDAYLDTYSLHGDSGDTRQHAFQNAMMCSGGKYALLYESGGTSFRLDTKHKNVYSKSVDNDIISGTVSDNGTVALITESSSYACSILVYDNTGKRIYQRNCVEYVVDIAFHKDNDGLCFTSVQVENGVMTNFVMNDKCAAGTGRFLEMMAKTLGLSLEEMSVKGLEWKHNIVISSMCTVFAESEVVSLVAQNKDVADIIHGLNVSVASKVGALAARLGKDHPGEYMMTGGVAKNRGIIQALEEKLGAKLYICDEAQLCGALGAALFAYEKCKGSAEETR